MTEPSKPTGLSEHEIEVIQNELDVDRHHTHIVLRADQVRGLLTERQQLRDEEIRRIKHLNRLATWAQQDATCPIPAPVQQWVLEEIKAALGGKWQSVGWEPDAVTERAKKAESELATLRAEVERLRESVRLADGLTEHLMPKCDTPTCRRCTLVQSYLASRHQPAEQGKEKE